MLVERTLFGTVDKIYDAISLLRENEPADGYYVCFSGGKDSVTILDLVKKAGVKFEAHYAYMTIEPPELLEFIVTEYPEIIFEYPSTNMFELIQYHHIPPMRQARYCCRSLKVVHGVNRVKVTGVRRKESRYRASRKSVETDLHGDKIINPIVDWTAAEVWEYIHKFKIPYCKLYDEGRQRIGCIFCPNSSYAQLQDDVKRYPDFVRYFEKALDMVVKKKLAEGKETKYKSGSEWFQAWIGRTSVKPGCNSSPLF